MAIYVKFIKDLLVFFIEQRWMISVLKKNE